VKTTRHALRRTLLRVGRRLERRSKRTLDRGLDLLWRAPDPVALYPHLPARKLLFVQPSFRIGNTVLATALLPALRSRFPDARIDCLAGDATAPLLENLSLERVYCISRRFVAAPWRFAALFARLQRERYDLAIDAGMGSWSGAFYALLSGAEQRAGFDGRGSRFLTVRFAPTRIENAYEGAAAFGRAFGVDCPGRPAYRVADGEREVAMQLLRELGLVGAGGVRPFVAAFAGGHQAKRWPLGQWRALLEQLQGSGVPFALFIGPDEAEYGEMLRAAAFAALRIVPPQRLRAFAALLAQAALLITTDSGPMHLAAALGVPSVALLQTPRSWFYVPRGAEDRALFQPDAAQVLAAVSAHPRWPRLTAPGEAP